MYAFSTLASVALLLASRVHAAVYVTAPVAATTCTAGQSCQVSWVDDGQSPLLSSIGQCTVDLYYTGGYQFAQSLQSVDVSASSSFSFTPDPAAGPDGQYYIVFTSTSISYQGFSASFTLTGMTGTTPGGGSTAPGTSTNSTSASAPLGTSTPVNGTTTPTDSTPVTGTTPATGSPTLTTPTVATTPTTPGTTTTPTTTTTTTSKTTSASASAAATNAAGRVGSSTSLGGLAALLVLSGIVAF